MSYANDVVNEVITYARENPLATIIQFITMFPYARAFWFDKKKDVLNWVAISCFGFAFGYFLFGAYSGIVIAIGTLISTLLGKWLGNDVFNEKIMEVKKVSLQNRILIIVALVIPTTVISLLIEQNAIMWLILFAGFLDYFAYIFFKEYDKWMHIVLIASQVTLVLYEVLFALYLFALLDFITAVIIVIHLIKITRHATSKIA